MLLAGKFSHVSVITIYGSIIDCGLFLYFTHIISVVKNRKQNIQRKRKMCQPNTEFVHRY